MWKLEIIDDQFCKLQLKINISGTYKQTHMHHLIRGYNNRRPKFYKVQVIEILV